LPWFEKCFELEYTLHSPNEEQTDSLKNENNLCCQIAAKHSVNLTLFPLFLKNEIMLPKMKDALYQSDTSKKRSTGSGYQMLTPMKNRLVFKLFPFRKIILVFLTRKINKYKFFWILNLSATSALLN
jgi:hypothetical protein